LLRRNRLNKIHPSCKSTDCRFIELAAEQELPPLNNHAHHHNHDHLRSPVRGRAAKVALLQNNGKPGFLPKFEIVWI
jgi:hypothetical protein